MTDERWVGKVAVITGASSGIGAATALRLAREGMRVWLVARRKERLEEIAQLVREQGGEAQVRAADLSDEGERLRLYTQFQEMGVTPEVLVNNAGFGWYGYFWDMSWQTAEEMLRINMEAVAHLTRLFLPDMVKRGSGRIINVGSIVGKLPNQGVAMYSASKAFLDAFTTSLYRELRGTGVTATVVRPGPVTTEFYAEAIKRPDGLPVPAERFAISAEQVAGSIWSVVKRPRRRVYVPGYLWLSALVNPIFGWLIDPIGPVLLRRTRGKSQYNKK